MALTINEIKNAKPAKRDYKLADSNGLFLLVTAAGAKSWRFKYRFGDRERLLTLGRYPDLGLVAAREAHQEARKLLAAGKDPATEKKKAKLAKVAASQATFRKTADEWFADQRPIWSLSNARRVRHRLERGLYPAGRRDREFDDPARPAQDRGARID
jgi:hypothetical protein